MCWTCGKNPEVERSLAFVSLKISAGGTVAADTGVWDVFMWALFLRLVLDNSDAIVLLYFIVILHKAAVL